MSIKKPDSEQEAQSRKPIAKSTEEKKKPVRVDITTIPTYKPKS